MITLCVPQIINTSLEDSNFIRFQEKFYILFYDEFFHPWLYQRQYK